MIKLLIPLFTFCLILTGCTTSNSANQNTSNQSKLDNQIDALNTSVDQLDNEVDQIDHDLDVLNQ